MKIRMPKIKVPKIPNPIKEIEKGVNQVVNQTTNAVNTAVKSTEQIAKDAVNSAKNIAVGPVYQVYVDTTKNAMKQANVEILNVSLPSPPVPTISMALSTPKSTFTANDNNASLKPINSSMVILRIK